MISRHFALALVLVAGCARDVPEDQRADRQAEPVSPFSGAVLQRPRAKPEFTLTSTSGLPYDFRRETSGKLTLLFFGYTYCPDVCPLHMSNIAAVYKKLPYEDKQRMRVVFVSTDPERDTPRRLRTWLDNFDPDFVGLTGPLDTVNAIQGQVGMPPAFVEKTPGAGPAGTYGVAHGAAVLAFTPDDTLRVLYPSGIRQQDWAKDIPQLIRYKASR